MKKTKTKSKVRKEPVVSNGFYKKNFFTLLLFGLILPLVIKVFWDIPSGVADYICNSYAGIYPTASAVGLGAVQIVTVLADLLRAGLIGGVLCALLYGIGRKMSRGYLYASLAVVFISPLCISAVGFGLNYACVLVGLSRDTKYFFEARLSELMMAAMIEYILYMILMILAVALLYRASIKNRDTLFANSDGLIPTAPLYRVVAIAVSLFGIISLAITVSDMWIDLKTYGDITSSLSGIMGYLVLPYVYLILKLLCMLFFASSVFRRK